MSSPTSTTPPKQRDLDNKEAWAARAAQLKESLLKSRRRKLFAPVQGSMSSSPETASQELHLKEEEMGPKVTALPKTKTATATAMANARHYRQRIHDSQCSFPATANGEAKLTAEIPSTSDLKTSSVASTKPIAAKEEDHVSKSNNAEGAKMAGPGPGSTLKPHITKHEALNKPRQEKNDSSKSAAKEDEKTGGRGPANFNSLPVQTSSLQSARERLSPPPTVVTSAPNERRPEKPAPKLVAPEKPASKSAAPAPKHDRPRGSTEHAASRDTRGPGPGLLPPRPGKPDPSKTRPERRQVRDDFRKEKDLVYRGGPKPSARMAQPSPRRHSAVRWIGPSLELDRAVAQNPDLRDWLELTGWNDPEFRARFLSRQRRLAEIEWERAELVEADQLDNKARPPTRSSISGLELAMARGSVDRELFPGLLGRRDDQALPSVTGVKREREGDFDDPLRPIKFSRIEARDRDHRSRRGPSHARRGRTADSYRWPEHEEDSNPNLYPIRGSRERPTTPPRRSFDNGGYFSSPMEPFHRRGFSSSLAPESNRYDDRAYYRNWEGPRSPVTQSRGGCMLSRPTKHGIRRA